MNYPLLFKAPPQKPFTAQATFPSKELLTSVVDQDGQHVDLRATARSRDGWITYEACALARAGQREVILRPGIAESGPSTAMHRLGDLAMTPDYVALELTDAHGSQRFSLTGTSVQGWHRWGTYYRQSYQHRRLGRFGYCHYWIGVREGSQQLDFVVNLHNGVPAADKLFTSLRVVTSSIYRATIADPAGDTNHLVNPGAHILPQQFNRLFRFSVGAETPDVEFLGIGDWSKGGYLPGGFAVPTLSGVDHAPALAAARASLAGVHPEPYYENQPVSALWVTHGSQNASEGGGIDRVPMLGVQWASTGDPAALELYRINQLRDACRARRRYDADGEPARLQGPRTWDFYDGFLRGKDSPWEWDSHATLHALQDPRVFADYGMETHERSGNDNWALKWLANDPAADRYIRESCSRARLQCWDDDVRLPTTPHLGSTRGSDLGQSLIAINMGIAIGVSGLERWRQLTVDHFRAAQMPSGVLHAISGGYPSDRFPFLDQYLLAGSEVFAMATLGLYQTGLADDVVRRCATGALHLFTDDDPTEAPGLYYFTAVGPRNGTPVRYVTDDDWPLDLATRMDSKQGDSAAYYTSWNSGLVCATSKGVGAPETQELIQRFTRGSDPHTWGLVSPHMSVPIDQWYPIL